MKLTALCKGYQKVMIYHCPGSALKENFNSFRIRGCSKRCELRATLVGCPQGKENGEEKLRERKDQDKMD